MPLRYRYQTFNIGEFEIRLRLLRDLEQFFDPEDEAKNAGISREAFPLFGIVWASSEVLAEHLREYDIAGKRILEVGCGMALVSHLLNARDADITAMDIHPTTGDLIEGNTALNGTAPIPFMNASWSDNTAELGVFDLIIGGDILYEPRHVKTLGHFLHRHAKTTSEVIIVDPDRGQLGNFHASMAGYGFSCDSITPDFSDHLAIPYRGQIHHYRR
jgi:predicted nicotinamide N-methyase